MSRKIIIVLTVFLATCVTSCKKFKPFVLHDPNIPMDAKYPGEPWLGLEIAEEHSNELLSDSNIEVDVYELKSGEYDDILGFIHSQEGLRLISLSDVPFLHFEASSDTLFFEIGKQYKIIHIFYDTKSKFYPDIRPDNRSYCDGTIALSQGRKKNITFAIDINASILGNSIMNDQIIADTLTVKGSIQFYRNYTERYGMLSKRQWIKFPEQD